MPQNTLFLCTGNSARSLIAEGILRHRGGKDFNAFSAGSMPTGAPNPFALAVLQEMGIDTGFARSKTWDEFAGDEFAGDEFAGNKFSGAVVPVMDLIITVCANAAGETCPIWPGHPSTAHWGVPDPAAVAGSDADKRAAFAVTFDQMSRRVDALLALGPDSHDLAKVQAIGMME